jgi:hypothetical protein
MSGLRIVGVHGIAQQQLGRKQLLQPWSQALSDGIELAAGHPIADPPLHLAFYGNLYLTPSDKKGPGTEQDVFEDASPEEVDALLKASREALTPEELAAAEALPPTMARTRTPRSLQTVLRGLDRKFGAAAGVLYLGTLRQVRRYLTEPQLKAPVDDVVDRTAAAGCAILIGHSLGSVVALEFLRCNPEHRVDLLLTVGSPLGLRMVQSRLPAPLLGTDTPTGLPMNVARWVNVRDPRDPVACAGDLRRFWPGIEERLVDNQGDAHNIGRYLSKIETGSVLLETAPELGEENP